MGAQTTAGLSFIAALVEVGATDALGTDISGMGASLAVTGGDRAIGEQHTWYGDTPIVKPGKRGAIDIVCRYVYTEEAAEAFEVIRALYETVGGNMYMQWSPKGGNATNFQFTTPLGHIKTFKYPDGEAGDGAVMMGEFTLTVPYITKSAVAG